MKALIPSQREKKRYLLVEGTNLNKNIPLAIKDFVGNLGMSEACLKFIKTNSASKTAIISVNRKSLDKIRASLCVWPEKISVKKVSGTLKGLQR